MSDFETYCGRIEMPKRDMLIDQLERRLAQRTETEALFTIRWRVV